MPDFIRGNDPYNDSDYDTKYLGSAEGKLRSWIRREGNRGAAPDPRMQGKTSPGAIRQMPDRVDSELADALAAKITSGNFDQLKPADQMDRLKDFLKKNKGYVSGSATNQAAIERAAEIARQTRAAKEKDWAAYKEKTKDMPAPASAAPAPSSWLD